MTYNVLVVVISKGSMPSEPLKALLNGIQIGNTIHLCFPLRFYKVSWFISYRKVCILISIKPWSKHIVSIQKKMTKIIVCVQWKGYTNSVYCLVWFFKLYFSSFSLFGLNFLYHCWAFRVVRRLLDFYSFRLFLLNRLANFN